MKIRFSMLWVVALGFPLSWLHGANTPNASTGQPGPGNSLRQAVASLAEKEKRPAADYARMAEETISFGGQPEAVNQLKEKIPDAADPYAPWRNMVNDALAGVDEGEKADAKAANWPELREKLKKLQPPPPPPSSSGSGKDKKDQPKNQKKDKKQQKGSGKDKEQQSGGGQKSEERDQRGGEGSEGEGEPEGSPSQSQPGKENKRGGQKEGGSGESDGGKSQNEESKAKDGQAKPGREDGQGQGGATMDQPGRGETAGFEKFGSGEPKVELEKGNEAENSGPPGNENDVAMRKVGGGTGKKEEAFGFGEPDPQSVSRLLQVKQADSPAMLQQNLDPENQNPQPLPNGKPW